MMSFALLVLVPVLYTVMLAHLLPFNLSWNILVNKRLIIWHERLHVRHICTLCVQIIFAAKGDRKVMLVYYIYLS